MAAQLASHLIIGGVASKLGGGRFENGVMTAAFVYLFNDAIATIWYPRPGERQIGHVGLWTPNGETLESQFPTPHGMKGKNTTLDWTQTLTAEGRLPDAVYRISATAEQDAIIASLSADERAKPTWHYYQFSPTDTNCSIAAWNILGPVNPTFDRFMTGLAAPWTVGNALDTASALGGSGVTKIPKVPF
jgi:hypothetical protein